MQTAEGMDVFDILPSKLFLIFLLMERYELPLDPEAWAGSPEQIQHEEELKRRNSVRLMNILMDDMDKRNCRHA